MSTRHIPPITNHEEYTQFSEIICELFTINHILRMHTNEMGKAHGLGEAFQRAYHNFVESLTEEEYSEFMTEYTIRRLS